MSDHEPTDDPLGEQDLDAAEREARRRAREERRRVGSEEGRRSLGERVSGALGGEPPAPSSEPPRREPEASAEPGPASVDRTPPQPEPPRPEPEPPMRFRTDEFDAAPQPEPDPDFDPIHRFGDDSDEGYGEGDDYAAGEDDYSSTRSDYGRSGALAGLGGGVAGVLTDPKMRVRLVAAAAGVLLVLAMLALLSGGGSEPEPVAAPVEEVETTTVTIPEGLTIDGMAEVAKEAKLKGKYAKAVSQAEKKFNLKKYGAADAPSLEGFLFPATYEVEKRGRVDDLVKKQLDAFEQNFAEVNLKQAKKKNLTGYDVVKIASMIEREVSVPEERKLVSAVIYNRLAAGNPLGIDATLRYELDNFTEPLLESELAADTPYNTRINAGLPPTPIGNPGLDALRAAAKPANSDFFYYVIEPGTCNEHFFTESDAEFQQAVADYQAALEAEGGSPTEC